MSVDRCTECGNALTGGVCGTCRPTGRPADKGERRIESHEAELEKARWHRGAVARKVRARPRKEGT